MCSVTVVFILLAIRFLFHYQGWGGLFSTEPFYNPKTFNTHTVWMATSYAAITYIGFDGVTTLYGGCRESEAQRPARYRAGLLIHGYFRWISGISWPAGLARLAYLT